MFNRGRGGGTSTCPQTCNVTTSTPFRCPHCTFTTSYARSVELHVKSVHERVKDRQCPHCPKVFTRNDYVAKHVKKWHAGVVAGAGAASPK